LNFTLNFVSTLKGLLESLTAPAHGMDDIHKRTNLTAPLENYPTNQGSVMSFESTIIPIQTSMTTELPIKNRLQRQSSAVSGLTPAKTPRGQKTNSSVKMIVTIPYLTPQRIDELSLKVGEVITIKQEFDDGWGLGVSEATSKLGYFPLRNCLPMNENTTNKSLPTSPTMYSESELPDDSVALVKRETILHSGENEMKKVAENFDKELLKSSSHIDNLSVLASTSTPVKSNLLVVRAHESSHDDELNLVVGDTILLEFTLDDGWGLGRKGSELEQDHYSLVRKQEEYRPLVFLVRLFRQPQKLLFVHYYRYDDAILIVFWMARMLTNSKLSLKNIYVQFAYREELEILAE
ncbi:hypothetical protein HK096_005385, partial [Nowakowskiella sp. JEL0078]